MNVCSYFKCHRCNNYKTERKCNILSHLSKKNKCIKTNEVENLSDIELYHKSLFRINEIPTDIILHTITSHYCEKCNKIFSSKYYMGRHFLKCKKLL